MSGFGHLKPGGLLTQMQDPGASAGVSPPRPGREGLASESRGATAWDPKIRSTAWFGELVPPRFSECGSACPCQVGDFPQSSNKTVSFQFRKERGEQLLLHLCA